MYSFLAMLRFSRRGWKYCTWNVVQVELDVDDVVVRQHRYKRVAIVTTTDSLTVSRDTSVFTDDVDVQVTNTSLTGIH